MREISSALALLAAFIIAPLHAQDLPDAGSGPGARSAAQAAEGGTLAERYEQARKSLEAQRAREQTSRIEHERLTGEANDTRARLVANAERIQLLESAVAETERRIVELTAKGAALTRNLVERREKVAKLLAVLQRLDADAPPALALRPDDSLSAARGAMLLGSALPPVYREAAQLRRDVAQLKDTRQRLAASNVQARRETQELNDARASLAKLLAEREGQAGVAGTRLAALHDVTEDVARQATDLKSLIARIATLRGASSVSGPDSGMVVVTPDSTGKGILRKGGLIRPVAGSYVTGDPAGPGKTPGAATQGLWFTAEAGAQAVAPADSEVIFAGAYQKFGQVLLLEIAGGYHLLMAGLGRIDVHIGDLVLAGEPVGTMSSEAQARLYFELRRNGQTVDPAPWMSASLRKASGL